jgi:hypothetical protein
LRFSGEKNSNWEVTRNGIVSHEDWLPTFAAIAGDNDVKERLLNNLRRDPFERAQHNSNTYNDWFLDRLFVVVPLQVFAEQFLLSMKEYPPSQTAGSFNLEKIQKQIEAGAGSQ